MKQTIGGESSDQDDNGDIRRKQIWKKWKNNLPINKIAQDTGESVEDIYRILAILQKAIIERIGAESHGRRKT